MSYKHRRRQEQRCQHGARLPLDTADQQRGDNR